MIRLRPRPADWDYQLGPGIKRSAIHQNIPKNLWTNYTQYTINHGIGNPPDFYRVRGTDCQDNALTDFSRPTSTTYHGVRIISNTGSSTTLRVHTGVWSGCANTEFTWELISTPEST